MMSFAWLYGAVRPPDCPDCHVPHSTQVDGVYGKTLCEYRQAESASLLTRMYEGVE